jgi:hypothetical protein
MVQKRSKTKGDYLQCPKCRTQVDQDAVAGDALSGTLDG